MIINDTSLIPFDISTRKGECHGVYYETEDIIYVHHITGHKCMKGLMNILINMFKTNHIIFTPLINDNIKRKVRGEIKIINKDTIENPYGEDIEIMDCYWKE